MLFKSTKSRPCGSLTRPPKTRWSLLMGRPLASKPRLLQSAFVARGFERRLAAGPRCLGNAIDQRLDRALAGLSSNIELSQLLPARFPRGIGGGSGGVGDAAADIAKQSILGSGSGQQGREQRAERKPAAKRQQRRSIDPLAGALAGRLIGVDRPLAGRRGGGGAVILLPGHHAFSVFFFFAARRGARACRLTGGRAGLAAFFPFNATALLRGSNSGVMTS